MRALAALGSALVRAVRGRDEEGAPYVNCRVMEGVLSDDQKAEIAEQITETFARSSESPSGGLTWVVIT